MFNSIQVVMVYGTSPLHLTSKCKEQVEINTALKLQVQEAHPFTMQLVVEVLYAAKYALTSPFHEFF